MEDNGIPFCLSSDLELVSYQKTLYPLCELLRKFAVDSGMAEVALENHLIPQRFHTVPWHQIVVEQMDNKPQN